MKPLLISLLFLCSISASAQDVIVKKDGSTIVCRVLEIGHTDITYKNWSELNGSNYIMDQSLVSCINFENGKKETFSITENMFKPGNQNDGEQQYNDRALLAIDNETYGIPKVRKLKKTAWIGGASIFAIGTALMAIGIDDRHRPHDYSIRWRVIGGTVMAAGVAWTTYFLVAANKVANEEKIQASSLYRHSFQFSNGTFVSIGADHLYNHTLGCNTVGLGLSYNF